MVRIYQFPSCPYCAMVARAVQTLGLRESIDYEMIDARRGTPGREEVVRLGGMSQVPFLVDGEVSMYESRDIVAYLHRKYSSRV